MVLGHFPVLALNYCHLISEGTHMYHILIKRQILRLSNDINNIKMEKRMPLRIN